VAGAGAAAGTTRRAEGVAPYEYVDKPNGKIPRNRRGADLSRPTPSTPVNPGDTEEGTTAGVVSSVPQGPRFQDALIGLTNVLSNAAPVYLMCGASDIRVMYQTRSPFTGYPTVFIYDNYPGGVGFSDKLYELHDEVFDMAERLIQTCGCESGCPSCVGPAGEFSDMGNPREDTLAIVRYIRGKSGDLIFQKVKK